MTLRRGTPTASNEDKINRGIRDPSKLLSVVLEFPKLEEAPPCPTWVKFEEGKKLWDELAPLFTAKKVFSTTDMQLLAHLCELHGRIVDGYIRNVPPTAAEITALRMMFSEFGMSPTSRMRLSQGLPGNSGKRFSKNGKKTISSPAN